MADILAWRSPILRVLGDAALAVTAILLLVIFSFSNNDAFAQLFAMEDTRFQETRAWNAAASILTGTALAACAMVAAWLRRFAGTWDAVGVLGAWMCTFSGYVDQAPTPWLLLPAFLAPWALLFVELAPRHRVILLLMQWLTSIKFLEAMTASTASTVAVAALGALHLVLVWVSLRGSPLGRVPLLLGAFLGGLGAAVTLAFLTVDPTPRRLLALVPSLALLAVVGLLAKGKLLAGARLPQAPMTAERAPLK